MIATPSHVGSDVLRGRVAVLGAGAIGLSTAALLIENGHHPALWSPSGKSTKTMTEGEKLTSAGVLSGTYGPEIAISAAAAISGAEAIFVGLPANGHRAVLDEVAALAVSGQTVIISSHASFGALYLSRKLNERGLELPIVAWSRTITRARRTGDASVRIATLRSSVDLATLPLRRQAEGRATCVRLFGERFVDGGDLLATTLGNMNPHSHLALALCNLTRMEKGERWAQHDCLTPAVGRLLDALDAERKSIAEAFGVTIRSSREHYNATLGIPLGPLEQAGRTLYERELAEDNVTWGPATEQSRYVLEDLPFGVVTTVLLGRMTRRRPPLHEAGLALYSALYGRDFSAENDLLPALGLESMAPERLGILVREGFSGPALAEVS